MCNDFIKRPHCSISIVPGETELNERAIHDKELGFVAQSDVVVADVTTPSLGVGYLIACAWRLNKRVVCLFQGTPTHKLSAMIQGNKDLEIYSYENVEDLQAIFQKCFAKV